MLELAYERKKVLDNINTAANNERRKQLRDHGTLLEEADIAEKFPVGGLVMLKSDNDHSRIDTLPTNYGPFYTLVHSHGNQIIIANLLMGQIKMRSYRNLISVLASPKLLSTTGLPQWLSSHPAAQVGKEGRTTQVTPDKAVDKHRALVKTWQTSTLSFHQYYQQWRRQLVKSSATERTPRRKQTRSNNYRRSWKKTKNRKNRPKEWKQMNKKRKEIMTIAPKREYTGILPTYRKKNRTGSNAGWKKTQRKKYSEQEE